MKRLYLDSSALVKLYLAEPESERLSEFVRQCEEPLPYTSLHELEFTQALERRQSIGDISAKQAERVRALVESDLAKGILLRIELAWPGIFAAAIRLLRRHGRQPGLRSLDSLHIACALGNKDGVFVTFDQRQRRAATAEKMETWPDVPTIISPA